MDNTALSIPPVAVASLYEALHQLSNSRRGQGKRYELVLILCLLVLAKPAGKRV